MNIINRIRVISHFDHFLDIFIRVKSQNIRENKFPRELTLTMFNNIYST